MLHYAKPVRLSDAKFEWILFDIIPAAPVQLLNQLSSLFLHPLYHKHHLFPEYFIKLFLV